MSQPTTPKRAAPMFVHREIDEAGLRPAEYRVLGRIARRGRCTESVPNMAKGCRLNADTVRAALKALVTFGMLRRTPRVGQTTVYQLAPVSAYAGREHPPETKPLPANQSGCVENKGDAPLETEGGKVPPCKSFKEGGISVLKTPPTEQEQNSPKPATAYTLKSQLEGINSRMAEVKARGWQDPRGNWRLSDADRAQLKELNAKRAEVNDKLARLT